MKSVLRRLAALAALLMAAASAVPALADPPDRRHERDRPSTRHDDRARDAYRYPYRGAVVPRIPPGHRVYTYRGHPYHYHDGIWYRPFGSRFMVVLPPVGLVVPILPSGAVVLTIGGIPYYRYGDVYYVHEHDGYRVVDPPESATSAPAAGSDELFVYPRNGQSGKTQATDRFECHEWASGQTGYDPTLSGGGVGEDARSARRADYLRAMTACLEGRGYSVR
ncbi:hypothetical protein G3580_02640 [Nitrogeniibacter mangrovi]|uniref:Glycine zipper family protein n=1 Tax=Nitrogeniibacter mangrovi TaxID=2016596 RepID=A0A6C1AZ23_9RHOO|nr:DUF6515 family protein [Nitrogeniibacter mangrovi]QID16621.1 hypothetical protein G3580_02640 [Nitrogeniibacter mangrovi]